MPGSEYLLLINLKLKDHLRSIPRGERDRLKEKLDFLANGLWDAGVRIKKLKGLSRKVVFEARLSRSRRLLFTLGRNEGRSAIYIWGIAEHDDIRRKAAYILPDNAPFLRFAAEAEESFPEICLDDLTEDYYSQESIDRKAPDDYGPQKWFVLNDDEWQRLLVTGDKDNIETFLYLTREQSVILDHEPPVLVSGTAGSGKTTLAVYYLLRKEFVGRKRLFLTYSPFLKRFSASIYNGLVKSSPLEKVSEESSGKGQTRPANDNSSQPDFLTFRELLEQLLSSANRADTKCAELEDFEKIYRYHSLHNKYDSELVWEEIRSIIKGAKPMINMGRCRALVAGFLQRTLSQAELVELKDYLLGLKAFEFAPKIERILELKSRFAGYDDFVTRLDKAADRASPYREAAAYLLQEVLTIIEKRTNRLTSPLLTFREYSLLGKKRAPNFLYDRKEIYSIAEYYQEKLSGQGLKDEIDLCREALQGLNPPDERQCYDLVVCDEVQDFADIQVSLIFRMARPFHHVLFTGDTKQIINPSGFRWEEVKDKFFERGVAVPKVYNLSLNFRCVGSIVKMSNALLDIKQRLVGLSGAEIREDWKFNGKPPCLVHGMTEEELLNRVGLAGANRIVLTRNEVEQRKLKQILGTELVFTIYEAKGLEFDAVLLWKFCLGRKAAEIWRKIISDYSFDQSHYPHIRHELNLLYVAITRARNVLMIYDGPKPADIWALDELSGHLYRTEEPQALSSLWERVSTTEEWKAQGDYFFDREYYPAARECYRNAGAIDLAERAEAWVLNAEGRFEKAAGLLEKHGYAEEAAESYERCGGYDKALVLWEKLGNKKRLRLCQAKHYEQQEDFDRAAQAWQRMGNEEKAVENWQKAGNSLAIARYYSAAREHQKAAVYFERSGRFANAAACYKKIKELDKAADLFVRSGDMASAIAVYKKAKNTKKLLECFDKTGDHHSAGLLYERQKDIEQAIESFRRFGSASAENRRTLEAEAGGYEKTGKPSRAAVRYSAVSLTAKSAPLFERARQYDWAVREYRKEGDHVRAAGCLSKAGDHYEAAREGEKFSGAVDWDWIEDQLRRHVYGGRRRIYVGMSYDKRRAESLYSEAKRKLEARAFDSALVRYKAIGHSEGIYSAYRQLKRDDEAIEYFTSHSMLDYAGRYIEARGKSLELSLSLLARLVQNSEDCSIWSDEERAKHTLVIRLLRVSLAKDREAARPIVEGFLEPIEFPSNFGNLAPEGLLELVLETRSYNALTRMAATLRVFAGYETGKAQKFFQLVKRDGERRQDANQLACYYYLSDTKTYEQILKYQTPDRWNYELFLRSRARYRDAVAFLLEAQPPVRDAAEKAAQACRLHGDLERAGAIYERTGDLSSAGRQYLAAGKSEDALRCYRTIADEPNIARTYERMERFEEAAQIWKKLGRKRDLDRARKKNMQTKRPTSHPELH